MVLEVGQLFDGRFKLLRLLGAGGLGTVFQAEQIDCHRIVALKVLHADIAANEDNRNRFIREARALNELQHTGIVAVYNVGIAENDLPYIAMEYVEGENLRQVLSKVERLSISRAIGITRQVADTLSFVHDKQIVHRDLKPDNIVIQENNGTDHVKIIDFGLARVPQTQKSTTTGVLIGSPDYMSPEQCLGKTADHRSDIYSLCVCFYEMLTGRRPFEAENPIGVLYKHINEPIPKVNTGLGQRVETALNAFFAQGMAKDPSQRFQAMRSLSEALAEIEAQLAKSTNVDAALLPNFRISKKKLLIALGLIVPIGLAVVPLLLSAKKNAPQQILRQDAAEMKLIDQAIKASDGVGNLNQLVREYEKIGKLQELVELAKKWRANHNLLSPQSESAYNELQANACSLLLQPERAEAYAQKIDAMRFPDRAADTAGNQSDMYLRLNQVDKAREVLLQTERALKPGSREYGRIQAHKADCSLSAHNYQQAVSELKSALAFSEKSTGLTADFNYQRYGLITALYMAGKKAEIPSVIEATEIAAIAAVRNKKDIRNVTASNKLVINYLLNQSSSKRQSTTNATNYNAEYAGLSKEQLASQSENATQIAIAFARAGALTEARFYLDKAIAMFRIEGNAASADGAISAVCAAASEASKSDQMAMFVNNIVSSFSTDFPKTAVFILAAKCSINCENIKEARELLKKATANLKKSARPGDRQSFDYAFTIANLYKNSDDVEDLVSIEKYALSLKPEPIESARVLSDLLTTSEGEGNLAAVNTYGKQFEDSLRTILQTKKEFANTGDAGAFYAAVCQIAHSKEKKNAKQALEYLDDWIRLSYCSVPDSQFLLYLLHAKWSFLVGSERPEFKQLLDCANKQCVIAESESFRSRVNNLQSTYALFEAYMDKISSLYFAGHYDEAQLLGKRSRLILDELPETDPYKNELTCNFFCANAKGAITRGKMDEARACFDEMEKKWNELSNKEKSRPDRVRYIISVARLRMRIPDYPGAVSMLVSLDRSLKANNHSDKFPISEEIKSLLKEIQKAQAASPANLKH